MRGMFRMSELNDMRQAQDQDMDKVGELTEDELEDVAGGGRYTMATYVCPKCGNRIMAIKSLSGKTCPKCHEGTMRIGSI